MEPPENIFEHPRKSETVIRGFSGSRNNCRDPSLLHLNSKNLVHTGTNLQENPAQ